MLWDFFKALKLRVDRLHCLMKRLTSKATFFYKRVFPLIWFGFLIIFLFAVFSNAAENEPADFVFLIFPIIMLGFSYFILKKMVLDLIDKVYDEGASLLVRNGNQEVRVSLKEIKNVSYSTMTSPSRVTLSIRHNTIFGDELSFLPPASWIPFKKNGEIVKLIDRIDEARNKS
jgi:hypothetical protein